MGMNSRNGKRKMRMTVGIICGIALTRTNDLGPIVANFPGLVLDKSYHKQTIFSFFCLNHVICLQLTDLLLTLFFFVN